MLPSKLTFGQEPAARWAQRHSAGKFCHGDGRNLTWLPEADGWINRGLRQRLLQGHWLNQVFLIKVYTLNQVLVQDSAYRIVQVWFGCVQV